MNSLVQVKPLHAAGTETCTHPSKRLEPGRTATDITYHVPVDAPTNDNANESVALISAAGVQTQ
jgi:hypothetical protein